MSPTPDPILGGLAGDDLERAKASIQNAVGIVQGRRRAAHALKAPEAPRKALRARWSPLLHPDRSTVNVWHGQGAPPVDFTAAFPLAYQGDWYRDDDTGDMYQVEVAP